MNNYKSLLTAGALVVAAMGVNAQKYTSGDKTLSFLAGEKDINLEYDYSDMMVGKKPEAQYKEEKIADFNKKQKGKGERWAEKWVNNRSAIYEPMFEELINKIMVKSKMGTNISKNLKDAKYTLVVHTTMTEPGFNVMVMKVDPSCNFEFIWKENGTGKEMAKGRLDRVAGHVMNDSDWDFDPSNRLKECYAKAGKVVGKTMEKALKPKKKK